MKNTGIQRALIIVNAATTGKDKAWLLQHLDLDKLQFQDISPEKVLIAVQGPKAIEYLQTLVQEDLQPVKAFGHLQATVLGKPGFIARTGYTGEDGFEVMLDPDVGVELWRKSA